MTQSNNEVVISISLIMVKCQWWLSALIEQINRVEKNINSPIYEEQVQRMADDHFLKISLKKKLEFICDFCNITPIFINGSIRKIDMTDLTYIEPHRKIINNTTFLVFNYSNDVYIKNFSNKIKINGLEDYLKRTKIIKQ